MKILFPIIAVFTVGLAADTRISQHEMDITLDPQTHRIEVTDRFAADYKGHLEFTLNSNLTIFEITVNGKVSRFKQLAAAAQNEGHRGDLSRYRIKTGFRRRGGVVVMIRYAGELFQDTDASSFSREKIAMSISATVSPEGMFLSPAGSFYPRADEDLFGVEATIHLPAGWDAVMEGDRVSAQKDAEGSTLHYRTAHLIDGFYITAAQWLVQAKVVDGVEYYTFFFPEDSALAQQYMDMSMGYVQRYSELLSPYPFSKFAVVENFFPTGYGMPSYTVLGRAVVRLPFIVYSSLGHEVLHNWWGNSVYVGDGGNWCEGLTTYQADYAYKQEYSAAAGRQYRKDILKDYTVYASGQTDLAPADFTRRSDMTTRSVGYGKVAMIFHMLESRLGSERFNQALREVVRRDQWTHASWSNFITIMEEVSGENLADFHTAWVLQAGAPLLELEVSETGVAIHQTGDIKPLLIPIRITDADGNISVQTVATAEPVVTVEIPDMGNVQEIAVDPDFHVMRRLHPTELDPTLRDILSEADHQFVVPEETDEWLELANSFQAAINGEGVAEIGTARDLESDMPVIYLGTEVAGVVQVTAGVIALGGGSFDAASHGAVTAFRHADGTPGLAIYSADPAQLQPLVRKLPHYGKYGYLVFESGTNVAKGNHPVTDSPLMWKRATE